VNKKRPGNVAASVRQRLFNHARQHKDDFQYVLTRYGLERLLYRLSKSPHAGTFVLKGAALFQLWSGHPHRPTRDLDLLGYGEPTADRIEKIFREVCSLSVHDDGLIFDHTICAEQIKEDDKYQGVRLRTEARLGNAKIPLQIDVGFGDVVTPGAVDVIYPTLLDQPAPTLRAYPRETVVAEKFQAMVMLGIFNSRMKDFYDLWILARQFAFEGPTTCQAIQATFTRRQTELPLRTPLALTMDFAADGSKAIQWRAFLRKAKLIDESVPLSEVVDSLEPFLMEPTRAIVAGKPFAQQWLPGGPWTSA
jgi:hypothetical protein